jgi:polyisoprenoid-binding protein YceI
MSAKAVLLTAALAMAGPVSADVSEWRIDPEHFSIAFDVDHIGYQRQIGLFRDAAGSFRYDPDSNELAGGRVVVRADSVFTDHDERDEHLRNDDFLAVDDHPEIVFEAAEWQPEGDKAGTLRGQLTLLGRTHPVELDVTVNKRAEYPFGHGKDTLGISARTTIQRSRWGMDYAVENGLVGDDVALRFEFEAIRQ